MSLLLEKMTQRLTCANKTIGSIRSQDLLAIQVDIPNIQRIRDDDKVAEIIDYQLRQLKDHGHFNFLGLINIHFCHETNEYLLVDGQHRYEAIATLANTINFEIEVEVVEVRTRDQLKVNYELINKNTPLPQFSERIDKNIPETVALYFKKTYPDMWSKSERARRPHIYFNYFQEALGFLVERLDIKSAQVLQQCVVDYNSRLMGWNRSQYPESKSVTDKIAQKCATGGLYLGLFKHVSDEYGYEWVRDIVKEQTGEILAKQKKQKKQIPKSVKVSVWNRCVGDDRRRALCICCNERTIFVEDFHTGHIVPESKNGSTTIDNLLPVCASCNLSMGATHMRDYMVQYHPEHVERFDTRRCAEPKDAEPKDVASSSLFRLWSN